MGVPYDVFTGAFLAKVTDYDICDMDINDAKDTIDGYMKRAIVMFKKVCKYDLSSTADDQSRTFNIDINDEDIDEIVDIISEGMIVQWLKPYLYKQENIENVLNTRDFVTYSAAELLMRVGAAYSKAQHDYTQMVVNYSYNHGDLSSLHL